MDYSDDVTDVFNVGGNGKVCLKSPGTDVGAAGFGMGVPGLLRQTLHTNCKCEFCHKY